MKPQRIEILGVPVDCITMDEAVDFAESMMKSRHLCTILAVNPEKVVRAQRDKTLLTQLRNANLVIPDGIGVVFAARLLGFNCTERVPGSELMPLLCQRAALNGYKVFLFGASLGVLTRTAQVLQQRFVGLKVIGMQHGYVKDEDMPATVAAINRAEPDLLFVALGSPKQELWMARYSSELRVKVCQGVGGTFDVLAGKVKRAPLVFRSMHLEWCYRLLSQPSRIIRQTALPTFAYQVLRGMITRKPSRQPACCGHVPSVLHDCSDSDRAAHHREKVA